MRRDSLICEFASKLQECSEAMPIFSVHTRNFFLSFSEEVQHGHVIEIVLLFLAACCTAQLHMLLFRKWYSETLVVFLILKYKGMLRPFKNLFFLGN